MGAAYSIHVRYTKSEKKGHLKDLGIDEKNNGMNLEQIGCELDSTEPEYITTHTSRDPCLCSTRRHGVTSRTTAVIR